MELSRRALDAYNAAIKKQGDSAEKAMRKALDVWFTENPEATIAETRNFCIGLLDEIARVYGNAAGDAAYALRSLCAEAAGVELPAVDYEYEPGAEYIDAVPRYQAEKLKTGDVDGFKSAMADAARYFSERGANDTMAALGRADAKKLGRKVRFARVPTGATTCPYCLMLASRGFVYDSELKALNANHRHCDCRIVEGFEGMTIEGYDPDLYYDMWKHPEEYTPNREFADVEYGEYRSVSYISDGLKAHYNDGTDLDPVKMVMDDTGFDKERAEQAISDMYQWTGQGYSSIRKREGEYAATADRIEEFIALSPKYKGEVWRGIGVERDTADKIIWSLLNGEEIDQLGIASWATNVDWAQEFADMNLERMDDGVKIIFELGENKTGVSIKHIAAAADNDEVIASENARYILNGDIELKSDPYDGDFYLIPVMEA